MKTGCMVLGIIEACAALLLIFLAYLIKYKKQVEIIAGYDERTCKDKDGLANWIGGSLLVTGLLCLLLAIIATLMPNHTDHMMIAFGAVILLWTIIANIGGRKFKT
ncbi:DUF3784 domain-containing protein [Mucilaginibacter lappiensis]|uniref:Membrane-anchored protein n=1 Tax=Mucilaginibacter lappiensis TaxID=354630 RepID=A0A1N6YZ15_9SPHI|nr:DUF3784 domain-containing protein [Mucilaginibacter lappiensis]MBB6109911.1 putative membrane-anchored protein [Mucilaginibacter lappiensis]MBB6131219.1 putative membrane-anchored protein [Mucilaginibacter lappiensis]SIR19780.1 protein of unknown function [Mucilaginibacter lappiensis]